MARQEIITEILLYMDLDEALEELDITPEEVLEILYRGGYVEVPDWVYERSLKY